MTAPTWAGLCAIAGMQVLIILGVFVFFWARDRYGRWECEHLRVVPVAVSGPGSFGESLVPAANRTTAVLWRCGLCSHVESSKIAGAWTLAQVLAWGAGQMPEDWTPAEPDQPLALTAGDPR